MGSEMCIRDRRKRALPVPARTGPGIGLRRARVTLPKASDEAAPSAAAAIGQFHASVDAFKKDLIRRALDQAKGNQTRAAELLGLQRTYLARLIKTFALREEPG